MSSLSHLATTDIRNRVSVAVAREALDVAESQGEAMVDMIRAAGEVGKSAMRVAAGDVRAPISAVPGAGETGGRFDVTV